jgi:hypothetical protein
MLVAEEAPKDLWFPFAFGILAGFTFSAPEQQQTRGQLKPWTGSSINLLPVGARIKAGEPQVWVDSCLAVDQLENHVAALALPQPDRDSASRIVAETPPLWTTSPTTTAITILPRLPSIFFSCHDRIALET